MLREEGFALTVAGRTSDKVEGVARDLDAHGVVADLRQEADCARVVAAHAERFGALDVLVNSVGIGIAGRFERLETKHLDLQLAVNLRATLLVTREAIPLLRATRGWIVNVASIAGTGPTPGLTVYGAAKAGVIALTHSLNAELEPFGVRAIVLCPGLVDTPMTERSQIPPQERIQPEDCAEVVRMCLRLSRAARISELVLERIGGVDATG